MANEVDIEIVVSDSAVDPALAALRAKIGAWAKTLPHVSILDFNAGAIDAQLSMIKSKLQAHKIADLLDVNLNPGQIESQLLYLKRKIEAYKISDLLDVNLNAGQLQAQMTALSEAVSKNPITVPVNLDVNLADLIALEGMTVGIGAVVGGGAGNASVLGQIARNTADASADLMHKVALEIEMNSILAAGFSDVVRAINNNGDLASHDLIMLRAARAGNVNIRLPRDNGGQGGNNFFGGFGWGRFLGGKIPLFGGVGGLGIGGLHAIIDLFAEVLAVVVPATIALGAFGIAAAGTVQDIITREQNLKTVSDALHKTMPGLSGDFAKVQAAVKPQVFSIMGEGLNTMNSHMGIFKTLAVGAGGVLDQLGARAELALGGHGLQGFILGGVHDLSVLGNIGGNVLGTLGNLLKTIPGYAQLLVQGLLNITHGLEVITGSGFVQGVVHLGLGFHGAYIYTGLLATAAAKLISGGLSGLAGLADKAAIGLFKMGGAGEKAGLAMRKVSGVLSKAAGLPWGWIAVGAGALVILDLWMGKAKTSAQKWEAAQESAISTQTTFAGVTRATASFVEQSWNRMKSSQTEFLLQNAQVQKSTQGFGQAMALAADHTGAAGTTLNRLNQDQQQYKQINAAAIQQQNAYNSRIDELKKNFGSLSQATGIAAKLGINLVKVTQQGGSAFKQAEAEMKGYIAAVMQFAGFAGGRALAAQNALNFTTNDTYTALQQVAQAQDAVINNITGGRSAFTTFQQDMQQMGKDAAKAKGGVDGLSKSSLTLGNDFYTTTVPAAQQLIDKLNAQQISTKKLTTVVADEVKQMIPFTKGSTDAKAVLVSLINNALGPGTVNLKTLNKWVGQNAGTMKGFNSIIAQSTINAGTLANTLESQLNVQFHNALIAESGASQALKIYTKDILNNTTQTSQGKSDRAQLIRDFENAGFSARDARNYVNSLADSIADVHSKTIKITENAFGQYTITGSAISRSQGKGGSGNAAGGLSMGWRVPGYGGGDKWHALLEGGEAVVPKHLTPEIAGWLKSRGVPGFSSGGYAGSISGLPGFTSGFDKTFTNTVTHALISALKSASVISGLGSASGGLRTAEMAWMSAGGPGGILAHIAGAIAGAESGWTMAIQQGQPYATTGWGPWQITPGNSEPQYGTDYALLNWGSNALAAVAKYRQAGSSFSPWTTFTDGAYLQFMDRGGWLRPGVNHVYNGTGRPERVPDPGGGERLVLEIVPGGAHLFEQFMAQFIKKYVRTKGGGDVQSAFKGYR